MPLPIASTISTAMPKWRGPAAIVGAVVTFGALGVATVVGQRMDAEAFFASALAGAEGVVPVSATPWVGPAGAASLPAGDVIVPDAAWSFDPSAVRPAVNFDAFRAFGPAIPGGTCSDEYTPRADVDWLVCADQAEPLDSVAPDRRAPADANAPIGPVPHAQLSTWGAA